MDPKSTARNFGVALVVQGFAFIVSATTSFIVPKVVGAEPFGYWQLFLFYVGFVGFLQFGLSDGVYLRFGGRKRSDIDAESVGGQFVVCLASQVLIGVLLAIVAGFVSDPNRSHVILAIAVMTPIMNAKRYWGYVFQAMNETKRFSYSVLVSALAFFVPMTVLLLSKVDTFEPYMISYVLAELASLCYCLLFVRGLLVNPLSGLVKSFRDSWSSIRVGVKLLIATLASTLVLGSARLVIDTIWSIRTFGLVSLAITMVGFFLTLMAQASMVLYPALRQSGTADRRSVVLRLRALTTVFLPIAYVAYFPIRWILGLWLPSYSEAFVLASILMPVCVFDGLMQILYSTYFKVTRREKDLMILNLVTVATSFVVVAVAGFGLGRVDLVLLGPSIAAAGRAAVADRMMMKELEVASRGELLANLALGFGFVLAVRALDPGLAALLTIIAYVAYVLWRRSDWVPLVVSLSKALRRAT